VQIEEPQDLKNGTIQEEEVPLEKPWNLKGGGQEKKTKNSRIGKGGGSFRTRRRGIQDIVSRKKTID
jgi:hypothetical protein